MTELTAKPIDINIPRQLSPLHDKAGEILEELQDIDKFINDLNKEIEFESKRGDYQASMFLKIQEIFHFMLQICKHQGFMKKQLKHVKNLLKFLKQMGIKQNILYSLVILLKFLGNLLQNIQQKKNPYYINY